MDYRRVSDIIKSMNIDESILSDFAISLGDLHQQINGAVGRIVDEEDQYRDDDLYTEDGGEGSENPWGSLTFEEEDDDGGSGDFRESYVDYDSDARYEEKKEEILEKLAKAFKMGGISNVVRFVEEIHSDLGIYLSITNSDKDYDLLSLINGFLSQYGFVQFFSEQFSPMEMSIYDEARPTLITPDSAITVGPSGSTRDDDGDVTEELGVSDEIGADPETEEPEELTVDDIDDELLLSVVGKFSVDTASEGIFNAEGEAFSDRVDIEIKRPKKSVSGRDLNRTDKIFNTLATVQEPFEQEGGVSTYLRRLEKARDVDESVTPMNFHPLFRSLGSSAIGFRIDYSGEKPVLIKSEASLERMRAAILEELSKLKSKTNFLSRDSSSGARAAGILDTVESISVERRQISNALDDLISAVKKRDSYINNNLLLKLQRKGVEVGKVWSEGGLYSLTQEFKDTSSAIHKELYDLTFRLVFPHVAFETFYRGNPGGKDYVSQFRENFETTNDLVDIFEARFKSTLDTKITSFFEQGGFNWNLGSYSSYIRKRIKLRDMMRNSWKDTIGVTKQWYYSTCAVCGKDIYTKSSVKGASQAGAVDTSEYSDYKIPTYSLFTKAGILLSEEMLKTGRGQSEEFLYSPPSDSAYEGGKSWSEITTMLSSGSRATHIEGAIRRAEALRYLGAKRLTSGKAVSDTKYKCPYSDVSDRPSALQFPSGKGGKQMATECGLYLDPEPIIESGGSISPSTLQTRFSPSSDNSAAIFEEKLDAAIRDGKLDPSVKDVYIEEMKRRSGGGWKFSNKFFNCPVKVNIPEEHKSTSEFRKNKYLDKYSYIASPISGPYSNDAVVINDDNKIDDRRSRIYPPINEDGTFYSPEAGTMTYLVCGAKTSVSSFCRDVNLDGSLPNLISKLMKEDSDGGLRAMRLIENLLILGVDTEDIIPFIENPSDPVIATDKLRDSGRLEKISGLLSLAMAATVDLGKRDHMRDFLTKMDVIENLKLTCSHGHTFSIRDSVHFGKTHTGIRLTNRTSNVYKRDALISTGALFSEGRDNFRKTLLMKDSGGKPYVYMSSKDSLIGPDKTRKYEFEEWRGKASPKLSETIFNDGEGSYYGFHSISRTFLWGTEDFSSADEVEKADHSTRMYLETNREINESAMTRDESGQNKVLDSLAVAESGDGSGYLLAGEPSEDADRAAWRIDKIGDMIKTFSTSIQWWLKLSTSVEIRRSLQGGVELISFEDNGEVGSKVEGAANFVVRAICENFAKRLDKAGVTYDYNNLVTRTMASLRESFLANLKNVDARVIYFSGNIFKQNLVASTVVAINNQIEDVFSGASSDRAKSILYRAFSDRGKIEYVNLAVMEVDGISIDETLNNMLEEINPEVSETDRAKILRDPLSVGRGAKWYQGEDAVLDKEGVVNSVAKMKGKAYMGRILTAASALYLADRISNLFNYYMKSPESNSYIGYDLGGLDLSTPEKVIEASFDDIEDAFSVSTEDIYELIQDKSYNLSRHLDNARACISDLNKSIMGIDSACISPKYSKMAADYITSNLSDMLQSFEEDYSEEDIPQNIKTARLIVDNVMTNQPFTTIDISAQGKYRKFWGGEDCVDPISLVPSFSHPLIRFNGDKNIELYPIYKLSDSKGIYHSFNFSVGQPTDPYECFVLSNKDLPNSYELPKDDPLSLPSKYLQSGWRIFSVKIGSGSDMYSDLDGSASVSYVYHPGTDVVLDDKDRGIGYRNDEVGLNTSESLFVGPLSTKTGYTVSFPPHRHEISNVGVPVPINFSKIDPMGSHVLPITGVRIPVEMTTDEGLVNLEMSDFLQREPVDQANDILKRIEDLYLEFKRKKIGLSTAEQGDLEANYKRAILDLHSAYKSMPFYVAKGKVRSKSTSPSYKPLLGPAASGKVETESSLYIPFVSWTIMNKFVNHEAFGSDWGGSQTLNNMSLDNLSSDTINSRKVAVEEFIIKTHGLDLLADLIGEALGRERKTRKVDIDPILLLDPTSDKFRSIMSYKEATRVLGTPVARVIYSSKTYGSKGDSVSQWLTEVDGKSAVVTANSTSKSMDSKFKRWTKCSGSFYSVGTLSGVDSETNTPSAHIRLINVIFPSNKVGTGDTISPREKLDRIRDPNSPDILTDKELFAHPIISGDQTSYIPYPATDEPKRLKSAKKVKNVSVVSHAKAIRKYLYDYMSRESLSRLKNTKKAGSADVNSIAVKFSGKINDRMYSRAIIHDRGLWELWSLITGE